MQLWLTDPNNIEKLLAMKKLQDESKKRKRTYDDSFSGKSSPSDISDLYSNPGMCQYKSFQNLYLKTCSLTVFTQNTFHPKFFCLLQKHILEKSSKIRLMNT